MILKVLIYAFAIFLIFYAHHANLISSNAGHAVGIVLLIISFLMVWTGVRLSIKRKESQREVEKKAFIFSFIMGFMWGSLMVFSAGFHYRIGNALNFLWIIINVLAIATLFAFSGGVVARISFKKGILNR